jgi:hypothetical protein
MAKRRKKAKMPNKIDEGIKEKRRKMNASLNNLFIFVLFPVYNN